TSEFKHRGYMLVLKERIESIWKYPKEAARQGKSGDLYIVFTIKRKGELGEVEVVRTSGHRSLDLAAIKALKDAAPFWPLPDDWPEEEIEIKGHFIYLYGRTHVM
ncbi:MAG: energy transducer TonB, partial [Nitrospira sp.]|nr:energy transducer TonB [Nitrospira sp.]